MSYKDNEHDFHPSMGGKFVSPQTIALRSGALIKVNGRMQSNPNYKPNKKQKKLDAEMNKRYGVDRSEDK